MERERGRGRGGEGEREGERERDRDDQAGGLAGGPRCCSFRISSVKVVVLCGLWSAYCTGVKKKTPNSTKLNPIFICNRCDLMKKKSLAEGGNKKFLGPLSLRREQPGVFCCLEGSP